MNFNKHVQTKLALQIKITQMAEFLSQHEGQKPFLHITCSCQPHETSYTYFFFTLNITLDDVNAGTKLLLFYASSAPNIKTPL